MYKVSELFDIAFGTRPIVYRPGERPAENSPITYQGMTTIESGPEATRISYMGTPILFPVTFIGSSYQVYAPAGNITRRAFGDFELPATTMVNFRRAKIVSKTKALAARGTVKEMYGFTDWSIDIRGICLRDPSHPQAADPYEQLRQLLEFEQIAESIEVSGELFAARSIYRLVIEDMDTPQVKGKPEVLPFYLRCSSDEPLELIL